MPAIKHWQILPVVVHHIIIIDPKATMYIVPFNQLIIPVRYLIFLTILFSTRFCLAQTNARTWEEEAGTNIRLLPAYGYVSKTPEMIRADDEFIRRTMERQKFEGSRRKASEEMVSIGFRYLNEN